MIESRQVEPIKEAQFTFVNFLWKEISLIREFQRQGLYYDALVYAIDLIDYLPNDFQETLEFQKKAKKIAQEIGEITPKQGYLYRQKIDISQKRNIISKPKLKTFMADLCLNLDKKGYLEKKGYPVEHGNE